MSYQFAVEAQNYEDLASGRVLYSQHGATAFPVRLTSEIFMRCNHYLTSKGNPGPYRIYDPCSGGGYLLTSIGFLHGQDVEAITASDIDPSAVDLASRNLSLLTKEGLHERIKQLKNLFEEYGKESHNAALESAERLMQVVEDQIEVKSISCFEADITKERGAGEGTTFDLIITDIPYGNIVEWRTDAQDPVKLFLDHVEGLLAPVSIVVIVSAKEQKIAHDHYIRVGQIKIGKRRVTMLEPVRQ